MFERGGDQVAIVPAGPAIETRQTPHPVGSVSNGQVRMPRIAEHFVVIAEIEKELILALSTPNNKVRARDDRNAGGRWGRERLAGGCVCVCFAN